MRPIKFRAWDKELNKMTTWGYIGFHGDAFFANEDKEDELIATNTYELMQFTGLLDKNKREIFEDDIIHIAGEDAVVRFENAKWIWQANDVSGQLDGCCEVIGNVWEQPEPLEQRS
jgi:hypothetical protein